MLICPGHNLPEEQNKVYTPFILSINIFISRHILKLVMTGSNGATTPSLCWCFTVTPKWSQYETIYECWRGFHTPKSRRITLKGYLTIWLETFERIKMPNLCWYPHHRNGLSLSDSPGSCPCKLCFLSLPSTFHFSANLGIRKGYNVLSAW